jgi:lipopolysaccharide export system protein LptC
MVNTTGDHYQSEERAREEARRALLPVARARTSAAWDSFIRLMRITLPIGALVLGSITILWPYIDDKEVSFTLSTDDVAKGDSSIKMTNMHYVGTDAVDRLFHVEAASGLQDSPNAPRITLSDIKAEMALDDTGLATVTARTGIYRVDDATLSLVGGVHMITGNGYALDMAGAEVNLRNHIAVGQGSITGRSKLGTLGASQVTIYADEEEGIFEGGVKLRVVPKRPDENQPPASEQQTNSN